MAALMKGHVWAERRNAKDRKGNPVVKYPVLVEDKHDEIRCHVIVGHGSVQFLSYAGKPLHNMGMFAERFARLAVTAGTLEFDVGFEVNENFNDSYRWVRSSRGVPEDLRHAYFRFYLFGLPAHGSSGSLQRMREYMRLLVKDASSAADSPWLYLPRGIVALSELEVDALFSAARAGGKEGVMVKQLHMPYERKRTDGWLKMKPEAEADGIITELHEGVCGVDQPELGLKVGDKLGRITSATVRMEDGSEATPHGISHEVGRDMLLHPEKYIGQWCCFKYMERDRQDGYRHPVFFRIREEK